MKTSATLIVLFFLLFPLSVISQRVDNLRFEKDSSGLVHIYYDLSGDKPYYVVENVYYIVDNGQRWRRYPIKSLSRGFFRQQPGKQKEIIWNASAEGKRVTEDTYFSIDIHDDKDIVMAFVEGGTFQMGSNNGYDNEKPPHTVTVHDFYIGKYEITTIQFCRFLNEIDCPGDGCFDDLEYGYVEYIDMDDDECQLYYTGGGGKKFRTKLGFSSDPVILVSWYGANAFARWAEGCLPTEAEWEFAARGGNKSKGYHYSGSNNIDEVARYHENSNSFSTGRMQKPNELDIYDMSGNAMEWCNDWYDAHYYSVSPANNPQGPAEGKFRVLRGGAWPSHAKGCRVTFRFRAMPALMDSYAGFRIVRK